MADWCLVNKKHNCTKLPPTVARLVANRGITTDEEAKAYISGGLELMHDPQLFKDVKKGTDIILNGIKEGKRIRIIGDYDADGVCSSAILCRGLKAIGAKVDVAIPHRVRDGYGLNARLITEAVEDGVDIILTCDNGIGAYDQIALAKEKGLTVVVTDHHEVPYDEVDGVKQYKLPPADALIDPKQADCSYPYKDICGALVAYKFIQYLYGSIPHLIPQYAKVCKDTHFDDELLQLAALATVTDIMPLRDENRVVVKRGLELMTSEPAMGIAQLKEVQGISSMQISVYHLGYIIGPCINAAGRLDSADRAFALLTSSTDAEALKIAEDLKDLNETRKQMEEKALKTGMTLLDDNKVQVVYLPECHESIAGIVAGKLKEACNKPVLVATRTTGTMLKGSGRSIDEYPLYHEMTKVKDLFVGFGGHALAAGFSLDMSNLNALRERLNANCTLTDDDIRGKILIDMKLNLADATEDLADSLETLAPFGTGNRKPRFLATDLCLRKMSPMGQNGKMAHLFVQEDNNEFDIVTFRHAEELVLGVADKYGLSVSESLIRGDKITEPIKLSVVYTVAWNEFRGNKRVQIQVEDFRFG